MKPKELLSRNRVEISSAMLSHKRLLQYFPEAAQLPTPACPSQSALPKNQKNHFLLTLNEELCSIKGCLQNYTVSFSGKLLPRTFLCQ